MAALSLLGAFVRRDWKIDVSYRAAFLLEIVATFFWLSLFFYVGRLVDSTEFSDSQGLEGGYFAYAAVGLALYEVVLVGLASVSGRLREDQTTGTLEILMSSPARSSTIVLFGAAYDLLRATFSGFLLLVGAVVLFGLDLDTDPGRLAVALAVTVASIALFASIGVAIAAATVVVKRAAGLLALVTTGLALLGGVYFPLSVLPEPVQSIAEAFPFSWALDVLRASLLGGDIDPRQVVGLFAAAALLLPASLALFEMGARRARREGSLAQY